MPASELETRWWLGALLCFAAFAALGAFVSARPPGAFDVAGGALRGQAVPLAALFTALGRWYAVVALVAAAALYALAARVSLVPVAILLASQTASQLVVAFAKNVFHRARPAHWVLMRERDFSYPSGHSVTSVVFYLSLLYLVLRAPLPRPVALALALALGVCVAGIPWSRLALAAHYPTDVLGGLLFGAGWLCALGALLARFSR